MGHAVRDGPAPISPYGAFLASKAPEALQRGVDDRVLGRYGLFPHQDDLTRWALRRGAAAIFAGTGLGKTRMEIAWANEITTIARKPALILTPLAVAAQTVAEGAAIGVDVAHCRDDQDVRDGVNVCNYERLHRLDPLRFSSVVLDESSIIKHHDAKTFDRLTEAFASTSYKLCATATPAPNDWTELGTHAEFLGVRSRTEMLAEFFVHDGGDTQTWRLKGHARAAFWRWVASWAAMIRSPADLGHDASAYELPPLRYHEHIIPSNTPTEGFLFAVEAQTLSERRSARRDSIDGRVQQCIAAIQEELCRERKSKLLNTTASITLDVTTPTQSSEPRNAHIGPLIHQPSTCVAREEQWVIWCDLNAEQDRLAVQLGADCVSIYGSLDSDEKETRYQRWARGEVRYLVSKPSIFGWGINMQFCSRMAFVGVTDSFEAYYQAVRRCWRFGQTRPVDVHVFASEAEGAVVANLKRKEREAEAMSAALSVETAEAVRANVLGFARESNPYQPSQRLAVPSFLHP